MIPISFTVADCFKLVRSLVRDEAHRMRQRSDPFGEELALTPESRLDQPPLALTPTEIMAASRRVAVFFTDALRHEDLADLPTFGEWAALVCERWGNNPDRVTLFTSGSMGNPKAILRELYFLAQDARFVIETFEEYGRAVRRIAGFVAPHHVYGFIYTVLLPRLYGIGCVDLRGLTPGAQIARLAPGDLLIGTPFHWKLLAQSEARLPSVQLLCSGASCPPDLLESLEHQGVTRWLELYGSTECGAMGYRFDQNAPMTLCPMWERSGPDAFIRRFADGRPSSDFGFQDHLKWVDVTRFYICGRRDEAIQIAGTNVYPAKVERCLAGHPRVAACTVRPMRPEQGDRLKAFVVPKDPAASEAALKKELQAYLAQQLAPLEQPRAFSFGLELPRTPMGKLADWP